MECKLNTNPSEGMYSDIAEIYTANEDGIDEEKTGTEKVEDPTAGLLISGVGLFSRSQENERAPRVGLLISKGEKVRVSAEDGHKQLVKEKQNRKRKLNITNLDVPGSSIKKGKISRKANEKVSRQGNKEVDIEEHQQRIDWKKLNQSSFFLYKNDRLPHYKEVHKSYPLSQISKTIARDWNILPDDEKEVYSKMADVARTNKKKLKEKGIEHPKKSRKKKKLDVCVDKRGHVAFTTNMSLPQFVNFYKSLTHDQVQWMVDVGLGGLGTLKMRTMYAKFAEYCLKAFNPATSRLEAHGRSLKIDDKVVHWLLGVRCTGEVLDVVEGRLSENTVEDHSRGFPLGLTQPVVGVKQYAQWFTTHHTLDDNWKRRAIIFTLGCLGLPISKLGIRQTLVRYVKDLEKVKNVNWAEQFLQHLCNRQIDVQSGEQKVGGGCMLIPMFAYLEVFQPMLQKKPPKTQPTKDGPRIGLWEKCDVSNRWKYVKARLDKDEEIKLLPVQDMKELPLFVVSNISDNGIPCQAVETSIGSHNLFTNIEETTRNAVRDELLQMFPPNKRMTQTRDDENTDDENDCRKGQEHISIGSDLEDNVEIHIPPPKIAVASTTRSSRPEKQHGLENSPHSAKEMEPNVDSRVMPKKKVNETRKHHAKKTTAEKSPMYPLKRMMQTRYHEDTKEENVSRKGQAHILIDSDMEEKEDNDIHVTDNVETHIPPPKIFVASNTQGSRPKKGLENSPHLEKEKELNVGSQVVPKKKANETHKHQAKKTAAERSSMFQPKKKMMQTRGHKDTEEENCYRKGQAHVLIDSYMEEKEDKDIHVTDNVEIHIPPPKMVVSSTTRSSRPKKGIENNHRSEKEMEPNVGSPEIPKKKANETHKHQSKKTTAKRSPRVVNLSTNWAPVLPESLLNHPGEDEVRMHYFVSKSMEEGIHLRSSHSMRLKYYGSEFEMVRVEGTKACWNRGHGWELQFEQSFGDSVIECFTRILHLQEQETPVWTRKMTTWFWGTTTSVLNHTYLGSKVPKGYGGDFERMDTICAVLNATSQHWFLLVISFAQKTVFVLDSLKECLYLPEQIVDKIICFNDMLQNSYGDEHEILDITTFPVVYTQSWGKLPIQEGSTDCGPFVCFFMAHIRQLIPEPLQSIYVHQKYLRIWVANVIVRSPHNTLRSPMIIKYVNANFTEDDLKTIRNTYWEIL